MTDPKLIKSKVLISYQADDGYFAELTYSTIARRKEDPKGALLEGITEAARLLALFGFEDQARAGVEAAFARVKEFKEQRAQAQKES